MISSAFNRFPEIKFRCNCLETIEHDLCALKDLLQINQELIFLKIFVFIEKSIIDEEETGNSIADSMRSFIRCGSSTPFIDFHSISIVPGFQKPALKKG